MDKGKVDTTKRQKGNWYVEMSGMWSQAMRQAGVENSDIE
jgi:hypothetical protein